MTSTRSVFKFYFFPSLGIFLILLVAYLFSMATIVALNSNHKSLSDTRTELLHKVNKTESSIIAKTSQALDTALQNDFVKSKNHVYITVPSTAFSLAD